MHLPSGANAAFPQNGNPTSAGSISPARAVRERGRHRSKLFIWQSPKNDRRWTIAGEVAFFHTVLMEADREIARFDLQPPPVFTELRGETVRTQLDAVVTHATLGEVWVEFKRAQDTGAQRRGRAVTQLTAQAQAAQAVGRPYQIKTEADCIGKEFTYVNWLFLCACMNRARHFAIHKESTVLLRQLQKHGALQVGDLLRIDGCDPALMLAAIGRGMQKALLTSDVDERLFGRTSFVALAAT